jgi:hypothetical protein
MAMQRVSSGYTVIEVMIFLGVSLVIAAASMRLISGKQSETDFNQKMRDTQSKIQDWINDVSTGQTGGDPDSQTCKLSGGRPEVITRVASTNYDPQCVYLGKVIQITDSSNGSTSPNQNENLYAYSVFGIRLTSSDQLPSSLDESKPDAAIGQNGSLDLTQTYSLSPAKIKSVCAVSGASCTSAGAPHLIGFMNSFNTEQNTADNGNVDLSAYQYSFNGNDKLANQSGSTVRKCLQWTNPCNSGANPAPLKEVRLCLTDGRRTAQIVISSNGGIGASVRLEYVAC